MHDEQDFLAAHGCISAEEYDRKRFFEWVEAMEDQHASRDPLDIGHKVKERLTFGGQESIIVNSIDSPFKAVSKSLVKFKRGDQASGL